MVSVFHQEELKKQFPPDHRLTYRVIEFPREQTAEGDVLSLMQTNESSGFLNLPEPAHRGLGKLGVFWHTQGSGKSYSMTFFAEKVRLDERERKFSTNSFNSYRKEGVKHFTLHQLRHLAASILKKEGATIAELQRFLRHDEQRTTEIYAGHLDNGTKAQNELLGRVWSKQLAEAV